MASVAFLLPMNQTRWLLVILGAVLLFCLPLLTIPFGRDQGDFAQMADTIQRGLAPYRDAWNPKPPLTFFLYAAALSLSRQMLAVGILNILIILATCVFVYALAHQLLDPLAALAAAFIYGLSVGAYDFWFQSQSEEWMNLPLVFAAWCFVRSRIAGRAWLLGSGAGLGLAFGFKYTGVALGLLLLLLLWLWPSAAARAKWREVAALALGFTLAVLPWLLFLALHGAIGDWLQSISVTGGYTSISLKAPTFVGRIPIAFGKFLGLHIVMSLLAAFAFLIAIITASRNYLSRYNAAQSKVTEPAATTIYPSPFTLHPSIIIIIGWLLLATISVIVQGKLYAYHWQVLLAPLALAAAAGFAAIVNFARRGGRLAQTAVATMLTILLLAEGLWQQQLYPDFLALVSGQQSRSQYDRRFVEPSGDFSYPADVQAATYLAAHTSPQQRIFIWGFEPLVYWLADRQPVSRFTFNFPLVAWWYPKQWQAEVIADLQQTPPTYVLVLRRDALPFVNNVPEDSAAQLKYFPALADFITRRYQLETTLEDFSLYRLK